MAFRRFVRPWRCYPALQQEKCEICGLIFPSPYQLPAKTVTSSQSPLNADPRKPSPSLPRPSASPSAPICVPLPLKKAPAAARPALPTRLTDKAQRQGSRHSSSHPTLKTNLVVNLVDPPCRSPPPPRPVFNPDQPPPTKRSDKVLDKVPRTPSPNKPRR